MTATATVRDVARRLHLGRAAMMLYYRPVGTIRQSAIEGGPWQQRRTEQGRREMMAAARSLPQLAIPTRASNHSVHFLTGNRYWYQTLFCYCSLQLQVPTRIIPIVHDDGSLTSSQRAAIERVVPWVHFEASESIEVRLDAELPVRRYPTLRRERLKFPLLRKIVDVYCGTAGWQLFLDSDMLFFRRPDELMQWLRGPVASLHLVDVGYAYGYSDALMKGLAGVPVPPLINTGVIGMRSGDLDWDQIEYWWKTMHDEEGPHFLQEQSVVAMLIANQPRVVLPAEDYVVLPSVDEGRRPAAALHHYVAHSKRSYFQHGWRSVVALLEHQASAAMGS